MEEEIVVTGMGLATACGLNPNDFWQSLLREKCGLTPLANFPSKRCEGYLVGKITEGIPGLGKQPGSDADRLAFFTVKQAIRSAALDDVSIDRRRVAIVLGGTTGGIRNAERYLEESASRTSDPRLFLFHSPSLSAQRLARRFGWGGPCLTTSDACASGASAIASGSNLLCCDEADVVIAGGVDALSRITMNGFQSMLVMDKEGCRPFDKSRQGMCLGEGAGIIVLERKTHATRRGVKALAQVAGTGLSCDAGHMTAPDKNGDGLLCAMQSALKEARLAPGQIGYVNAHGTGTLNNDLAEATAMKRCFATPPAFSSIKRFVGHTLAASGAIEAVACVLALLHQTLPPNPGFTEIDPEIGLTPLTSARESLVNYVMSNSLAFGGSNVSLIFRKGNMTCLNDPHAPININASGAVFPSLEPQPIQFHELGAQIEAQCRFVHLPEDSEAANLPGWRRLSRGQKIAVHTAYLALKNHPAINASKEKIAVLVGTGLGETGETAVFLGNLIHKREAEPMPQRFINSVHNSMASAVAIAFGFKGANRTFLQGSISFEVAMGEAVRMLRLNQADHVLVGGIDLITPYALLACAKSPIDIPGEGSAFFLLSRESTEPDKSCRLRLTSTRQLSNSIGKFESEALEFISTAFEKAHLRTESIDAIILDISSAVSCLDLLSEIWNPHQPLPVYSYTHKTSSFPTRSALGWHLAATALSTGKLSAMELIAGVDRAKPKTLLLLNCAKDGSLSASFLSSA